jgi:hypothetical protein
MSFMHGFVITLIPALIWRNVVILRKRLKILHGGPGTSICPTAGFSKFSAESREAVAVGTVIGFGCSMITATNRGPCVMLASLATEPGGGTPQFTLTGEHGLYFLLQYPGDLQNWTTWTNTIATGAAQNLAPPVFPGQPALFYRAVSVQ